MKEEGQQSMTARLLAAEDAYKRMPAAYQVMAGQYIGPVINLVRSMAAEIQELRARVSAVERASHGEG